MGKWVHRISCVDEGSRTGKCAHCGPVKVKVTRITKSGKMWACSISRDRWKGRGKTLRLIGTSAEEYELKLREAEYRCEICGVDSGDKFPQIDHDHLTNKFRGILCGMCNRGLGSFRDNTDLLEKAIAYLQAKKAQEV